MSPRPRRPPTGGPSTDGGPPADGAAPGDAAAPDAPIATDPDLVGAWLFDEGDGAVKLYVDGFDAGAVKSTVDAAAPLANSVAPTILIGYSDGYLRAVGAIDDVLLWKRALTPEEVKALAAK